MLAYSGELSQGTRALVALGIILVIAAAIAVAAFWRDK